MLQKTVNTKSTSPRPPQQSKCAGADSVQLDGYNGTAVQWSPPYLALQSPPSSIGHYLHLPSGNHHQRGCNYDRTWQVAVTVLPEPIASGKANILIAVIATQLCIRAAPNPGTIPNNPNIPNPPANGTHHTNPVHRVDNGIGCGGMDSVTVICEHSCQSWPATCPMRLHPTGMDWTIVTGWRTGCTSETWVPHLQPVWRAGIRNLRSFRCWDGRYKGKIADQGTYVYYIKAETSCGTEEQKATSCCSGDRLPELRIFTKLQVT